MGPSEPPERLMPVMPAAQGFTGTLFVHFSVVTVGRVPCRRAATARVVFALLRARGVIRPGDAAGGPEGAAGRSGEHGITGPVVHHRGRGAPLGAGAGNRPMLLS
jgi:hypothetical protein